ncbi:MAG: hypothetical protein ACRDJJ_01530 [Actinomycetota bacterium]
MIAGQRAYSDAVRWLRSARRRSDPWEQSRRAFLPSLAAGIAALSAIAIVSTSSFGLPGRSALRTGWPGFVLLGLVGVAVVVALARRRHISWVLARAREPFTRPLTDEEGYASVVEALSSCPAPFRTRFFIGWVLVPAALWGLGALLAFSSAYFVVDAVLARLSVDWFHPAFGVGNAFLSYVVFRIGAARISTWRLAVSAHRAAAGIY